MLWWRTNVSISSLSYLTTERLISGSVSGERSSVGANTIAMFSALIMFCCWCSDTLTTTQYIVIFYYHYTPNNHRVYTHTHTIKGPFSGTTQVSRYQKGKTNLDYTEARDSEWQWHQLGHMQVCTSLQTDNHASTPPLSFLQAGCPSCRPTNSVKALKARAVLPVIVSKFWSAAAQTDTPLVILWCSVPSH